MGPPVPPPRTLPRPEPVLDEETRERLEAQLPKPGGEVAKGMPRPERPTWLVLAALALVVGSFGVPAVARHTMLGAVGLSLVHELWKRVRRLRETTLRSAREQLSGECWLLSGGILLCLPVPFTAAWTLLLRVPLACVALFAFGIGLERRVFRPRRLARRRR